MKAQIFKQDNSSDKYCIGWKFDALALDSIMVANLTKQQAERACNLLNDLPIPSSVNWSHVSVRERVMMAKLMIMLSVELDRELESLVAWDIFLSKKDQADLIREYANMKVEVEE